MICVCASSGIYMGLTPTTLTMSSPVQNFIAIMYGSNKYIACDNTNKIYTSTDGYNFTQITTNLTSMVTVYGMKYIGNRFYAYGIPITTNMAYSTDGITWSPTSLNVVGSSAFCLLYNGSIYMTTIGLGSAHNSSDGINFSVISAIVSNGSYRVSIACNGNNWIATNNVCRYSTIMQ